jgi:hypothetical protein
MAPLGTCARHGCRDTWCSCVIHGSMVACHSCSGLITALFLTPQIVTGLTVALATLLPRQLAPLTASAEGMAQILMQVELVTYDWCL